MPELGWVGGVRVPSNNQQADLNGETGMASRSFLSAFLVFLIVGFSSAQLFGQCVRVQRGYAYGVCPGYPQHSCRAVPYRVMSYSHPARFCPHPIVVHPVPHRCSASCPTGNGGPKLPVTPRPSEERKVLSVDCVLIFDTNDGELDKICQADRDRMVKVLTGWNNRITDGLRQRNLQTSGQVITWTVLQGDEVNNDDILAAIDQAAQKPKQALFVWYTGHGQVNEVAGRNEHVLVLSGGDRISRSDLFARMQQRKAPLTVLLTDSCSEFQGKVAAELLSLNIQNQLDVLSDLFLRHIGEVDINSSTEGQVAIGIRGDYPNGGALLGKAWEQLSASGVGPTLDSSGDRFVSWREMASALTQEVQARYKLLAPEEAVQKTQTPQAYRLEVSSVGGYPQLIRQGLLTKQFTREVLIPEN